MSIDSMIRRVKAMILRYYWRLATLVSASVVMVELLRGTTGAEYGVGIAKKVWLVFRMRRNTKRIRTASHWLEHVAMAIRVLKVPRATEGVLVECGSYKGGSSANLSLVAALCGRRVVIFDSFKGIPEPSLSDELHLVAQLGEIHSYALGAFKGELNEVKANIAHEGEIAACDFNAGFFEETLPGFREKTILVFADVDLRTSLECCVRHLWPLLQDGCCFFAHEAHHAEIASLFFERDWWERNLSTTPPGMIGAGSGLGLLPRPGAFGSALGYATKNPVLRDYAQVPQSG